MAPALAMAPTPRTLANSKVKQPRGTFSGRLTTYTHDCTVLADSSHGDSHVGSVSPAATRTRTLAATVYGASPSPSPARTRPKQPEASP